MLSGCCYHCTSQGIKVKVTLFHWLFKPCYILSSQVGFNNRKIFMGYFSSPADAARAYDKKVVQLHGALGEWGDSVPPCLNYLCVAGSRSLPC
jgi:hypothetical protein